MNTRIKYPRTFHLPWSPGLTKDDKRIENLDGFIGREVVVTEKMDGEFRWSYSCPFDGFSYHLFPYMAEILVE